MYFMGQNKKKEETKKKERAEKAKLKDVNMAAPSFDRQILNEQHAREKAAKEKERATPGENAVSESPLTPFSKLFRLLVCTSTLLCTSSYDMRSHCAASILLLRFCTLSLLETPEI